MGEAFTLLDHTADVKVRATGPNFGATLANVARGMLAVLYDSLSAHFEFHRELEITGYDRASLVVSFLNEILYTLESEGLVPVEFSAVRVDGHALVTTVGWGRPSGPALREIKAATYHDLKVTDTVMEVVFDL
ncbi:MAG: archease [Bacillota bacterium]